VLGELGKREWKEGRELAREMERRWSRGGELGLDWGGDLYVARYIDVRGE
jgi:hypothetical protein